MSHLEELLKLEPDNEAAKTNIEIFREDLKTSATNPRIRKRQKVRKESWTERHDSQCRGEERISEALRNRLFCRYVRDKPIFVLKPLKEEKIFEGPDIFVYHNFLEDFEMKQIKKLAYPLLSRATVHDPLTGKLMYADYRVSKSAWLKPEMDEIVANVINKIGVSTNLDVNYAESLQVANYGIGGQYEPHYDHSTRRNKKEFKRFGGNRIATFMMYLTDVQAGGGTVFTDTAPGAVVKAIKGNAVFWYNLKRNGKGDKLTQHAGCPVLSGTKWISNLWIHEHGQEFRRPCTLNKDE